MTHSKPPRVHPPLSIVPKSWRPRKAPTGTGWSGVLLALGLLLRGILCLALVLVRRRRRVNLGLERRHVLAHKGQRSLEEPLRCSELLSRRFGFFLVRRSPHCSNVSNAIPARRQGALSADLLWAMCAEAKCELKGPAWGQARKQGMKAVPYSSVPSGKSGASSAKHGRYNPYSSSSVLPFLSRCASSASCISSSTFGTLSASTRSWSPRVVLVGTGIRDESRCRRVRVGTPA